MKTALDSNILSALWTPEASAATIANKLKHAKQQGSLVLSPVAHAELFAHPGTTEEFREQSLREMGILTDYSLSPEVWDEAGRRFSQYANRRRRSGGGQVRRLVPDFIIGAHALLQADCLMTTDAGRYQRDFPELRLILGQE